MANKTYECYIKSCTAGGGTISGAQNPVGVPYTNTSYASYELDVNTNAGLGSFSCTMGTLPTIPAGAIIGSAKIQIKVRAGAGTQKLMVMATADGYDAFSKMNNVTGDTDKVVEVDLSGLPLEQLNHVTFTMYNGGTTLTEDETARLYGATLSVTLLGETEYTPTDSLISIKGNVSIEGVNKSISDAYVDINGVWKPLARSYSNIDGVWKLASSVAKWKKYQTGTKAVYLRTSTIDTTEMTTSHYLLIPQDLSSTPWSSQNNKPKFTSNTYTYVRVTAIMADPDTYKSQYILGTSSGLTMSTSTTAATFYVNYAYKWTGTYTGASNCADTMDCEVYQLESAPNAYIETVYSSDRSAYPNYGVQDDYFYVYDGEISFDKYSISYPMTEGSEASFTPSSLTYPILMASSVSVDSFGNVTWGSTYSASSTSNMRSNYSSYPYTSFATTLTIDDLYKITSSTIFSSKRKSITFNRTITYEGIVEGTLDTYPYNAIHTDGYYYAPIE